MEKTLYAMYTSPANANDAFVELLQRGAGYMDILLITKRTYKDPAFDPDDEMLDVPGTVQMPDMSPHSAGDPESIPPEENIPLQSSPFGDIPGGMWLMDNLRYPGDLTACLRELGFARDLARDLETSVLQDGALLIMRAPSGPVDDNQGWQTMERHGGAVVAPRLGNPYVG
jgi:hypothetical protein